MDNLNPNELEALRVLWEGGEQKPAQIQEQFSRPIDNGTLRSVLRVLMDKGYVTRKKAGKAYLYRARTSRAKLLARMTRQMAHVFTGGSRAGLILHLLEAEDLPDEAIAELKRIADSKTQERKEEKQ